MAYEGFEPDDREEQVLDVLKQGRDNGEPWGYTSVAVVVEKTGIRRQTVGTVLDSLCDVGWVERRSRGFYKFIDDPRE